MRRLTLALLLALTLAPPLAAKEWRRLRIATEGTYPPFSLVTPAGELAGFDIDIANALCAELKLECTLVQQDWDGLFQALAVNKIDAIVASVTITEDRRQNVLFTEPYYKTPVQLAARKDAGLNGDAASLAGRRIGVQRATTHECYATKAYPGAEVVRYGTSEEANLDLIAGRVDAVLGDKVGLTEGLLKPVGGQAFALIGPELRDDPCLGEGAGIAVRLGEDDLKAMLDRALAAIRADGRYAVIAARYFDFDIAG